MAPRFKETLLAHGLFNEQCFASPLASFPELVAFWKFFTMCHNSFLFKNVLVLLMCVWPVMETDECLFEYLRSKLGDICTCCKIQRCVKLFSLSWSFFRRIFAWPMPKFYSDLGRQIKPPPPPHSPLSCVSFHAYGPRDGYTYCTYSLACTHLVKYLAIKYITTNLPVSLFTHLKGFEINATC